MWSFHFFEVVLAVLHHHGFSFFLSFCLHDVYLGGYPQGCKGRCPLDACNRRAHLLSHMWYLWGGRKLVYTLAKRMDQSTTPYGGCWPHGWSAGHNKSRLNRYYAGVCGWHKECRCRWSLSLSSLSFPPIAFQHELFLVNIIQDDSEADEDDDADAERSEVDDYFEFFHIPRTEERRAIIREALVSCWWIATSRYLHVPHPWEWKQKYAYIHTYICVCIKHGFMNALGCF